MRTGQGKRRAEWGWGVESRGGGGQGPLTMRVGVHRDGPRAGTASLVPAVVGMLHPGAGGTVVHAFILGPQAMQAQPMALGPHQLHADGASSGPDAQLGHTVLAHAAHQLGRARAQLPSLGSLHPPAGRQPQPWGAAPHRDVAEQGSRLAAVHGAPCQPRHGLQHHPCGTRTWHQWGTGLGPLPPS